MLFAGLALFGLPGAAAAFALRLALESACLLYLARVPTTALRPLALPGALVFAAVAAAALIAGPLRHLAIGGLLVAATVWSMINIPDVLRPYLRVFTRFLPKAWRGADQSENMS
jgi:hypothetical protein